MKQCTGLLLISWTIATYIVHSQAISQTNNGLPLRLYVTNVRLIDQKGVQSGVLFDLTDSSVVLAPIDGLKPTLKAIIRQHNGTLPPTDSLRALLSLRTFRYANIGRLTLHRRGHAAKGFLIGAGVGVLAGFIRGGEDIGFLYIPASSFAIIYGLLLSPVGLLLGAASTKSVNSREQSVATEVPSRFRKFTIVEQVNQATLYTP